MQRLFFHNKHDKASREILSTLPEDYQVIDVFGGGKVPGVFRIHHLPYIVDKYITLDTEPPYNAGTFILEFTCRNHKGNILTDETSLFRIEINGCGHDAYPKNGVVKIEIDCPVPMILQLRMDGCGYMPWVGEIEVVGSA